jgi:hypothetical protein
MRRFLFLLVVSILTGPTWLWLCRHACIRAVVGQIRPPVGLGLIIQGGDTNAGHLVPLETDEGLLSEPRMNPDFISGHLSCRRGFRPLVQRPSTYRRFKRMPS